MENNAEFRARYANMPMEEFKELPAEELREISKVRYETGYHAGNLHYIALRAQTVLSKRKFLEQEMPSEVKIIVPEKDSFKEEAIAAEKMAGITLRPQASRDDMIETIKKEYKGPYLSRILNNLDGKPQKQDFNGIISCLRKLFPSTYDFREAKKLLSLDDMDKLELCYTRIILRNMWEEKRDEEKENWKQSILEEYGSWQEYFKACGWTEHKGSYYKPELVKKTAEPDVFQQFNVVSYRHENRKGYRGKKSEAKEKAVLEERV